jgi:hypothetical protein
MEDHIRIFTNIYETSEWGSNHHTEYSGSSGGGSSISVNIPYINFMRNFIDDKKITSVIDLGCGDWQSSYLIYDSKNINYYGYDAYKKLIDYNSKKYPQYTFLHLDILNTVDAIKEGDLCILKDIIQHWTCSEITRFLDKLISSKKFKYILINNSSAQKYDNQDEPFRSRPLSIKFYPLKKYDPTYLFSYSDKEVSLICCDTSV